MKYSGVLYKAAWGALMVLLGVGVIWVFLPKCNELRTLQRQRAELQEENRRLRSQICELVVKQDRIMTDAAYLERVAREEMGLVKTNETIFRYTKNTVK